jgi:hypothetical protein
MQHDTGRPVAVFEFFAGAAWAWIVAARSRRFVELSQSFPGGFKSYQIGHERGEAFGYSVGESRLDLNISTLGVSPPAATRHP